MAESVEQSPRERADAPLEELRTLAETLELPDLAASIDRTISGLSGGHLRVAVVGQFKRGKSTLLNAIVGRAILPTGVVPMTSVGTEIVHGHEAALVEYEDGRREGIEFPRVNEYVTETLNPSNSRGVVRMEIRLPLPEWARGLTLLDTPGVGSVEEPNTVTARKLASTADAAIFVVSPEPPLTDSELRFIAEVREHAARFFFVMNKVDAVDGHSLHEILQYTARTLRERAGIPEPTIYPISALQALSRSIEPTPNRAGGVGFDHFVRDLRQSLGIDRSKLVNATIRRRVHQYARRMRGMTELQLGGLRASDREFESAEGVLLEAEARMLVERRAAEAVLEGDLSALLSQLAKRLSDFEHQEGTRLVADLEGFLRDTHHLGGAAFVRAFDQRVRELFLPRVAAIRRDLEEEATPALDEAFRRYEERMDGLTRDIDRRAGAVFHIDLPDIETDVPLSSLTRYYARTDQFLEGSIVGQASLLLPGSFQKWRLRGQLGRLVREELDGQSGRLRDDFHDRIHRSANEFKARSRDLVERHLTAIRTALQSGRLVRQSSAASRAGWEKSRRAALAQIDALLRTFPLEAP